MGGTLTSDSASALAVGRGRLQAGGALVAGGAAAWLAHSALMIIGFVAILGLSATNVQQAIFAASTAMLAFLGAIVAVLLASLLLGIGLLVYPAGTAALRWQDWSGRPYAISAGTRAKGRAAGVLVIVYGIQGILAVVFLLQVRDAGARLDLAGALSAARLILYDWTIAAILLVVASSLHLAFLGSLRREIATSESLGGIGLLAYSIVNVIGVFLLTIPLLSLLSNPLGSVSATGLAVAGLIGVLFQVLVVPIIGIVVFALTIVYGVRLRKLVGGTTAAAAGGVPFVPIGIPLPNQPVSPAQPLAWSAGASYAAPTAGRLSPSPVAESAAARAADSPVLRLQTQIDQLERAIREQKALLYDANVDLENGTFDNATHDDLVRKGREKIARFQREVGERRAELAEFAERSSEFLPPPDDFENG